MTSGILLVPFLLLAWAFQNAPAASLDDASRYSNGPSGPHHWMSNGHQGDPEFGAWSLETEAPSGAPAGHFVGSSRNIGGGIDAEGKSFGLFANHGGAHASVSTAVRRFAKPALTAGDVLRFHLALDNIGPGHRGFELRNHAGVGIFKFDAHSGALHINGRGIDSLDAASHTRTVLAVTFTQRERHVEYSIHRPGGHSAPTSGHFTADSGSIADVKFQTSGTSPGDAGNLYFNHFSLATEPRGDAPLALGELRLPGFAPSHLLRFSDPAARNVALRHAGDDFKTPHALTRDGDGVWSIDIRNILPAPGWHEFQLVLDGAPEPGGNRWLHIDPAGRIALPPAVYLLWQSDPSTTMTVHWLNQSASRNQIRHRIPGTESWIALNARTRPFPHSGRFLHTAEITGLDPDSTREFQVDGYDEIFRFRTMPASLDKRPVVFAIGGDVDVGPAAEAMTAAAAAKNPDFFVIGGDHAYDDAKPSNSWRWFRHLESFFRNARAPDGRLIPLVMGIGNHEVRHGYAANHPDFDDSPAWRVRHAPFFYHSFAFPGPDTPYRALDFGDYLSLLITDTEHSSPVITGEDSQTRWLAAALDVRRSVPHVFPVHHVPAYTSHRPFEDPTSQRIRRHWVPLYESAGVRLVFEHHDHTFKRTKPLLAGKENPEGIRYLGDGLWGIAARPPDPSRPYLEAANDKHHVHLVTLTSTGRTVEALDAEGNFFGGRLEQSLPGK